MVEQEKSNIVSEQEFLAKLGFGNKPEPTSNNNSPEIVPVVDKDGNTETIINSNNTPPVQEEDKTDKTQQPETVNSEEEIQKQEQTQLKKFGVRDTIATLIENNDWEDVAIQYGDKEYENIEALLEKEKPTKELFEALSKVQKNLREEKIKEEYVSIKGRNETDVKLIQAILSGTDYEDLLKYKKSVVEPVRNFDFINQDATKTELFVRQCLKDIDNLPEKYIEIEIQELKKEFKLIEKAEEFQEKVIQDYNNEIELRTKTQETLKAKEEEEKAINIKSLKKNLKEKSFTDSFIQKAVQLRYSKDSDGKFHYEKLLEDKLKDEEFASQFIHFMLDKEDFLNKEKTKVKTETATNIMRMIHIIPKDKGAKESPKSTPQNLSEADEKFLAKINYKPKSE